MNEYRTWQRLLSEFVGTALLVFVGVGSVPALAIARAGEPFTGAELGIIALAFGTIVMAVVYVFGYISGAHINPAVTVALAATRKFPWREVPGYVLAQVLGATIGAFAIVAALGRVASDEGLGIAASSAEIPFWQMFAAEAIGTFVLVLVVFGLIHRRAAPGMAGIAIGFTVFAVIVTIGAVTGGSINPARNTGPMLVQTLLGGEVAWEQWPVYVIAQLVGGVVAGALFAALSRTPSDREERV
ncbi:aquaporin family protein [Leucobacter sp. CSA1]|uniref:Aquaporin family protein n=1 Tax=Leucobacter chromiisoli TaxID=2796471 RepID=A0A934UTX9_9MICO|nr:MIP/aquaporin family protein [Leucobacter chromiisoli]MBK0417618.1 aquaporin family protein [Leucobacter chromiisoli]